jgi:hypothetical protein
VSGKFAAGGRGGGRFTYAMKVPDVVALVRELLGQRHSLRADQRHLLRKVTWLSVHVGFTGSRSRGLNRQSCDRDYNSRKEPADAEEHQNIVDFGHGLPPLIGERHADASAVFLQSFVGDGVRPVLRRKIKSNRDWLLHSPSRKTPGW